MIFKIKRARLERTYLPGSQFFIIGYATKNTKTVGSIKAETQEKAAEILGFQKYLAFSFLPKHQFTKCKLLLEKGLAVPAYLIEV